MKNRIEYEDALALCQDIFSKKAKDYGTAWRVMRTTSLIDQLRIKAKRIKEIQEVGTQRVDEGIDKEFQGIVNYSIMTLIQVEMSMSTTIPDLSYEEALEKYIQKIEPIKAWQEEWACYHEQFSALTVVGITIAILRKLDLMDTHINNREKPETIFLEKMLLSIANFSLFALVKMEESKVVS